MSQKHTRHWWSVEILSPNLKTFPFNSIFASLKLFYKTILTYNNFMKKKYKPVQFTIVNIEADIIVASPVETTWAPTGTYWW